jgi:arginyl-tRNA synthetase
MFSFFRKNEPKNMACILAQSMREALQKLSLRADTIAIEHPAEPSHGDYSTNAALVAAKEAKANPRDIAAKIVSVLEKNKSNKIETIEIAGPGFINFKLAVNFFRNEVKKIAGDTTYGHTSAQKGKKIFIEHTQPNPFKEFHIGHLMNNAIGESLSHILAWNGATLKKASYHGDVGLHVAKAIWALMKKSQNPDSIAIMGVAYAEGHKAYEEDTAVKEAIIAINKKIYDRSDEAINTLYDLGRKNSLAYFEELYKKLGSDFDYHFYESEAGPLGKEMALAALQKGIFESSDGAVVFKGEKYGLHTRVFLTKDGLPTYESKDLGLVQVKCKKFAADTLMYVTANEQTEYFKVVKKAIELVYPELAGNVVHVAHGMLKLPTGKMSSRTGNVISAVELIADVEKAVEEKVKDRGFDEATASDVIKKVAMAAIKYTILRQAPGSDVIFDFNKSISFEGDSGPYLQYSYVRAMSIIEKAKEVGIKPAFGNATEAVSPLEKYLYRFPEIVERAGKECMPHYIATYLIELSSMYNHYYAEHKIVDANDPTSAYKVGLTLAFANIVRNGLYLLGIDVPEKM